MLVREHATRPHLELDEHARDRSGGRVVVEDPHLAAPTQARSLGPRPLSTWTLGPRLSTPQTLDSKPWPLQTADSLQTLDLTVHSLYTLDSTDPSDPQTLAAEGSRKRCGAHLVVAKFDELEGGKEREQRLDQRFRERVHRTVALRYLQQNLPGYAQS
eukprot:14849-Rhodomonas_salina.2